MLTINYISGLGADERVFQFLSINDSEKRFIKWIDPFKDESIEHYAQRLTKQFDLSKRNLLICVSFGGLIGVEIAKLIPIEKTIIISSVKNRFEIPFYYRILGKSKVYKLIPGRLIKSYNPLLSFFFGVKERNETSLLREIIKETDVLFFKWAISKIFDWENTKKIKNLYHIHGTKDRLFPLKKLTDCIEIKNGHHFMIVTKADDVSKKINEIIKL